MGYGLFYLLGAVSGLGLALIVYAVVSAKRRRYRASPGEGPASLSGRNEDSGSRLPASPLSRAPGSAGSRPTVILEKLPAQMELQLDRNLGEFREMAIKLAQIVNDTKVVSDQAAAAFSSAKSAITGGIAGRADSLEQIKAILTREVDALLESNSALKGELNEARKNISSQRRQIEELRQRTRIDSLTNIPNRAAFDERLREYLSALDRLGRIFSLLMLDIDFFKRINDTLGHVGGDRVLRGVAGKIIASVRPNDFVARYGGEEFVVLFPETALEEGLRVAERIRFGIANANFRLDSENIKVTISGGLIEGNPGLDAESLIAGADQALYWSKENGRNRISCSGRIGEEPPPSVRGEAAGPADR
jgi:diguanylate cyclase